MALIENFLSITQEQVSKTLLKCEARASVYVRENPSGKASPDFDELLDDMAKLNDMSEGLKIAGEIQKTVLIDTSGRKML